MVPIYKPNLNFLTLSLNITAEDPNSNNTLEQVYVQLGSRARLECLAARNPATQTLPPPITYSWSKLRGQGRRTGISRHTSIQGVSKVPKMSTLYP